MPKFHTAVAILASYTGRNNIVPGESASLIVSAAAEDPKEVHVGRLNMVEAMAVQGFNQVSGPLQWVKAKENLYIAGGSVFIGDYAQVTKDDATRMEKAGRVDLATDEEVAAAQAAPAKADK